MNIAAINLIEEGNMNPIYLYKEGSFWKAYEQSAYLFVTQIKKYQTKMRYYKVIDKEMVSIGFPDSALGKLLMGQLKVKKADKEVDVTLADSIDGEAFVRWKAEQPSLTTQSKRTKQVEAATTENQQEFICRIRSFPLANSSPMECMQFVAELQQMVSY